MTDTTDTKALRTLSMQRVKEIANGDSMLMGERVDLANTAIRFHKELDVALDAFKNAATELFSAQEQLEAERQRADNWSVSFENERLRADKLAAHIEALKGDQVPIAWLNDAHLARGHIEGEAGEEDAGPGMIPVYREKFTAPQKPIGLRQIGSIDHDGGEFAEYFVEFTDSAQVGQAVYVIDSAIESAGGKVAE